MIGVKPLFSGRSLGDGEQANFDVIVAAPNGTPLARTGMRYELLRVETRYQWYRRDNSWDFEPVKTTKRVADGDFNVAADAPARLSLPVQWGRYRLEVSSGDRSGPVTSIAFDAGFYADASADTPDLLEIALDKPEYAPGDTMTVAVTARTAGQGHAQRDRRPAYHHHHPGRAGGCCPLDRAGRQRLGQRRLCGGDAAPPARHRRRADAGARHRRAVVRGQSQGAYACGEHGAAATDAAEQRVAHSGEDRRA